MIYQVCREPRWCLTVEYPNDLLGHPEVAARLHKIAEHCFSRFDMDLEDMSIRIFHQRLVVEVLLHALVSILVANPQIDHCEP